MSRNVIENHPDALRFGRMTERYGGNPVVEIIVAPIVALTTAVLGFGADILAYKIIGSVLTVWLIVQAVLTARNWAVCLFDGGFVVVNRYGRVTKVVPWADVLYVDGVTVNVTNGAFTLRRRDITVRLHSGTFKFNDVLVRGGAQLAARIAVRAQA